MSSNNIRVLQLSPQFPFPADDGGKIGISSILKCFAEKGFEIDFVSYISNKVHPTDIKEAEKYANVYFIEHSTKNTPEKIFSSLFQNTSLYIQKHINCDVQHQLKSIISDNHYDFIHADHSAMCLLGLYAKSLTNAPLGLRLHNIEHKIWERYADSLPKNSPKGLYIRHQANLLKNDEKFLFPQADICFPITEVDKRDAMQIAPEGKYVTASAGVYPEEWEMDPSIIRNPHEIIIATVYSWVHNVDGVLWFIENVFPKIKEVYSDVTLTLIGKNPPSDFQKYTDKGVNVIGYVPKVQPYLNKAALYIAPLFVGSGIRIKILEAMAIGLPVIATSVASEGINGNDQEGLFIRDRVEEWVDTIVSLLKEPENTEHLRIKAQTFIRENYSWKKNVDIMINEYIKLISKQI
jgi:glycosyltransferase involved in cell wall biosynthesis